MTTIMASAAKSTVISSSTTDSPFPSRCPHRYPRQIHLRDQGENSLCALVLHRVDIPTISGLVTAVRNGHSRRHRHHPHHHHRASASLASSSTLLRVLLPQRAGHVIHPLSCTTPSR